MIATELGRLAVATHGSGARRIVLWHGLFLDGRSWDPLLPALGRVGTVHVVDGPGHGGSEGPDRDYTMAGCAAAAVQLLDALGAERVDWIGNAWGGHVGVRLAVLAPDRVRSLAVLASPMQALRPMERLKIRVVERALGWFGWHPTLVRMLADGLASAEAQRRDPQLARYLREAPQRPPLAQLRRAIRSVSLARATETELARVTAPTLFVAGEHDPLWPPELAERQSRDLVNGSFERVAEAHHLPQLESPTATEELLLRWLGSV